MKMNLKVRIKNPWFWIGLGALILSASGVDPETFTSWDLVWDAFVNLVTNPFRLVTTALSVVAVFVDPTTKGISDSDRAMTYTSLGGDEQKQ